jgi:ketosteroid isomerase-like protein
MLTKEFAAQFAQEWIAAWNSHDLERILSHYADDIAIESPIAASIVPESGGSLQGKEAVRKYWALGLQRIPGLKFELMDVLTGVNGLTLYYRNLARGTNTAEVMWINDAGKVHRMFAYYT